MPRTSVQEWRPSSSRPGGQGVDSANAPSSVLRIDWKKLFVLVRHAGTVQSGGVGAAAASAGEAALAARTRTPAPSATPRRICRAPPGVAGTSASDRSIPPPARRSIDAI